MKLTVYRQPSFMGATIGRLLVDGVEFCHTLEDEVREVPGKPVSEWKVSRETAIPKGTYSVIIDFSEHFQRDMPHILNVPGFTGVRIHNGNTKSDTDGCILVGMHAFKDSVTESRIAFDSLFAILKKSTTPITIEVL